MVAAVVFMGCAVAGTMLHLGGTVRREDLLVKEIKEMRKEIQRLKKEPQKQ